MILVRPNQSVQWEHHGKHYVGKLMQAERGLRVFCEVNPNDTVLVQLDYGGGLAFVNKYTLRPCPDSSILEPTLPAVEGQQVS